MAIDVFSKPDCELCGAAKKKLDIMRVNYRNHDLQEILKVHEGWREDGSIDIVAGYASIHARLPVIRIAGDYHDYPGAMKRLKATGQHGVAGEAAHEEKAAVGAGESGPVVH